MNFVRGMEPLRAMKIGIITWKNLSDGCLLKSRRWVPLTECGGVCRFTSDGAKQNAHILALVIITIQSVEIKKLGIIKIQYQHVKGGMSFIVEGSIERFRKYFDIIQER
jgi:hypothetical protein